MRVPALTNCKHCGTEFKPRPFKWRQGLARFCSKPCGDKGKRGTLEERFWRSVLKTRGCWNFQKTGWRGYGRLCENRHHISAHRFSWELHFGPIPDGLLICHKCDNPACVRPSHLFLGTSADNAADMLAKGRRVAPSTANRMRGSEHYKTAFKDTDIRKIRRLYAKGGILQREIGNIYGVSPTCISHIIQRKSWAHIH